MIATDDASGNTTCFDFGPIEPNLDLFFGFNDDCLTCYFRQATLERIRNDVKKLNGGD